MKMKLSVFSFATLFSALIFTACNFENYEEEQKDKVSIKIEDGKGNNKVDIKIENKEELKEAFNKLEDAFKNVNIDVNIEDDNGEKIEPVRASDLKKILPRKVAGLKKQDSEASGGGAFGMNVAAASAHYGDGDETVEINIVDGAGIGKLFSKIADWSEIEIDKTTRDGGFERTTTLHGHKVIEKFDPHREAYELVGSINDRYLVTIKGENVSQRRLKWTFDDIQDDLMDLD